MSLILDHVNYVYGEDTALAVHALKDSRRAVYRADRTYRFGQIYAGAALKRADEADERGNLL